MDLESLQDFTPSASDLSLFSQEEGSDLLY